MALPDYQTLMLPVLRLAAKGETSVPIASQALADEFHLTPEERDLMLPSGAQRVLHNRVHWAKFYLSKAGLIEQPRRGRFLASEKGRQVLQQNPARIDVEFLLKDATFADFYRGRLETTDEPRSPSDSPPAIPAAQGETPEEQIDAAYQTLSAALSSELLARILQYDDVFFEALVVDLLVAMGYGGTHRNAAERLGRSGDGGVDGVISEDRLGLDRIYIQAKRYQPSSTIGRPAIQAFVGSLVGLGATKGVFITTSSYSAQALDYVSRLPQRVVLIDGARLTALMIEHNIGVRTNRVVEFKRVDEDYFSLES